MRLALVPLALIALSIAGPAAATGSIDVNSHGVVVSSTLPHCAFEDGSGGPRPCTWNIGPGQDGDGIGLAYWVSGTNPRIFHYVWAKDPIHGPWHYVNTSPKARCVTNGSTVRCPDGSS